MPEMFHGPLDGLWIEPFSEAVEPGFPKLFGKVADEPDLTTAFPHGVFAGRPDALAILANGPVIDGIDGLLPQYGRKEGFLMLVICFAFSSHKKAPFRPCKRGRRARLAAFSFRALLHVAGLSFQNNDAKGHLQILRNFARGKSPRYLF
ncbi:hypothetical protein HFU84_08475 [Acidithiobacillus sp. CV18-2]|nr:hypothetical protein [Acidithiobacillus sp. CV18-3]MBU2756926.1 hypothetical protein [Acidithiobacillus sp. BN09-2]MBU2777537.1 hypothetical protein [Acidithiobacillus sp. CV18-2]MBU2799637.1 hypothetical protein [Acidithiobacillus sp. VAN18-4]